MDSHQAQTSSNGRSILLIDDQRLFIKSISTVLETWGYQVSACTSPIEALVLLKENYYSLVLCDLYMDSFSGYKLLYRFLQEKPEQVCCLMTSAENDEPLLRKTLALTNVKALLRKPISYQE
ncbi:MAG: response regulator [Colwellia sp.]|nr:response regulator [Colwellia sp.]